MKICSVAASESLIECFDRVSKRASDVVLSARLWVSMGRGMAIEDVEAAEISA